MTDTAEAISTDSGIVYGAEAAFQCPTHGEYRGQPYRMRLFGKDMTERNPECPSCKAEAVERKAAEERAKAEADAKARAERRFIMAGVPRRFWDATLDNYQAETKGQERALKVARKYVERFEERRKVGGGLIFVGKPGTGKTHLLCAMAAVLPRQWSVRYTDCWSMISEVKATFKRGGAEESEIIKRYVEPDLLMVDEVGVQYGSDAERAIIHRILDLRYQAIKPSIVSGNVDLDGMGQYLGERAVSRLHEGGGMVLVFDWEDHRRILPTKPSTAKAG